MAFTEATVSYNLSDYAGEAYDLRRSRGWLVTNIESGYVTDDATGDIRVTEMKANVDADGTGSVTIVVPGSTNPDTWQTTFYFDLPEKGRHGKRQVLKFGPFTITETSILGDLVEEQAVPAEYITAVTAQLDAKVTEAEAAVTAAQAAQAAAEAARDQAQDISNIDTPDALVATLVEDSGSATAAALSASIIETGNAALSGAGGALNASVRRLVDNVGDFRFLVVGDSTSSSISDQWPEDFIVLIKSMYPAYTVRRRQWDNTAKTYGTATQVGATGTGPHFIDVYSGGVGGTVLESNMASWETYVAAVQPHCTFIHFGHNYGKTAAEAGVGTNAAMDEQFRERMMRFALRVRSTVPEGDLVLNSQNPYLTAGARDGLSSVRAQIIRSIANDLGCAYGPVCETFISTGNPAAYLQADLLHPTVSGTTNGALLTAQALVGLFEPSQANIPPSARVPSSLLVPGRQLLLNGSFADFASPPTLANWTASNATLSKETTQYESRNAYSLAITATGGSFATAFQSLPIRQVAGQIVTVAARVYVPTASTVEAGRIQISGDGGLVTAKSAGMSNLKNQWAWVFATARVPAAATFATVSLFGGAGASDVAYFDRASAVLGSLPRDIAA